MPRRVLFIAALHHPQQLLADIAAAPDDAEPPLFPRSMGQHGWERAFREAGYTVAVFWRNLPGFGSRDIASLRQDRFSSRWTPRKILSALNQRIPPSLQPDLRRRNQLLLAEAARFQPDIIWLSGDNREITPQTLARLKDEHGCKLIYVSGVSPIVFSSHNERSAARLYDLVLVNDYYHGVQWQELGARRMACLPYVAVDPALHVPQPLTDVPREYLADIGFVGTLLPYHLYSERVAALECLRDFDLGIWSIHELPKSLRAHYRGSALGETMLQTLSSVKICLNAHGDFMRYGGNMRLFEAAALGAFQIVDDRPGLREWFTIGEHLEVFRNVNELRDKVAHYLAHDEERLQMAAAARDHVLKNHTYAQRLARVEALLEEI
ncbi:MAG: glycosyltransferase [Chloroflexi bacterium]|nr:glycosyltransferase [Chloroflexota bacterium]MCY4247625.1 glycosyltransferase [Chloroflexota bacterium]